MWLILSLLGGLSKSTGDIITKKVLQTTDTLVTVWARILFFLPFVMIPLLFYSGVPHISQGFYVGMLFLILVDVVASFLYTYAMKISDLSIVAPMLGLTPLFIIITGYLILGETVTLIGIIGLILIVLGTYVVGIKGKLTKDLSKPIKALFKDKGARAMMLVAILFSILPVLMKYTTDRSNMFYMMTILLLADIVIFTIVIAFMKKDVRPVKKNFWLFLIGAFVSFVEVVTVLIAFTFINVSYAMAVKRSSIPFSSFFGFLFFKEKNIKFRLFGSFIIFLGIIILVFA